MKIFNIVFISVINILLTLAWLDIIYLVDPDTMFIGIAIIVLLIASIYYLVLLIIAFKYTREKKLLQNKSVFKHILLLFFSLTPIILISLLIAQVYF